MLSLAGSGGALEISLQPFSGLPRMALSVRDVRVFAMDREARDGMPFFDFTAQVIEPPEPRPALLPVRLASSADRPSLLWPHGDGPTSTFDVVAAVVQVLNQIGR